MLDGAFTSPKIRRLSLMLSVPWPHAIGLCGLLWRFTAKHAPSGEIGRHDDEEIAAALEWPGDEASLVGCLVRCKLLDAVDPPIRLIVHDWPDHAPRYVLATLRRRGGRMSPLYDTARDPTDQTAVKSTVQSSYTSTSTPTSTHTSTNKTFTPDDDDGDGNAGSNCHEDAVRAVPDIKSMNPITKSRNRLDRTTRTARTVPEIMISTIWDLWVPGRKRGKKIGTACIEKSILDLAAEQGIEIRKAALFIAKQTKSDADDYKDQIEQGKLDPKYVPLGSTYFKQERWNDADEQPDVQSIKQNRIADDLERARSKVGRQLDPDS